MPRILPPQIISFRCLVAAVPGMAGFVWCPNDTGRRVGEAVFLAGALTITVDPFLESANAGPLFPESLLRAFAE